QHREGYAICASRGAVAWAEKPGRKPRMEADLLPTEEGRYATSVCRAICGLAGVRHAAGRSITGGGTGHDSTAATRAERRSLVWGRAGDLGASGGCERRSALDPLDLPMGSDSGRGPERFRARLLFRCRHRWADR